MTHRKSDDPTPVEAPRRRRGFLFGASALAAAGWTAGGTGSWFLPAAWGQGKKTIRMGIATDITGPIAPSGNSNWQVAQLAVEQINAAGGIAGRPVELFLEDTASDPKAAVANVRKLIQRDKVDVVLGGITSAMRQAIKDPIVNRGRTLYIYPQLYEGQECTKHLFNTGPTPAQQIDELIPYLVKSVGKKRFAMPSANYVWPQLLNKYARKVIEANGAEVVFEEYYPLDQAEYSATINKIRDGKVDCVFITIIPPGLQPFMKQLYESGFQQRGGVQACVYFDENSLNYVAPRELEGVYSCLATRSARSCSPRTRRSSRARSTSSPRAARRPACTGASGSTRRRSTRPRATSRATRCRPRSTRRRSTRAPAAAPRWFPASGTRR